MIAAISSVYAISGNAHITNKRVTSMSTKDNNRVGFHKIKKKRNIDECYTALFYKNLEEHIIMGKTSLPQKQQTISI